MQIVKDIFTNPMLLTPLIAWGVCQVIKFITSFVKTGKLDFKKLVSDGGMPSAHSATVMALTVTCGWTAGFDSAVFAAALVFTIVIMRDAVGVRQDTGKNARAIKKLLDEINETRSEDDKITTEKLKLVAGHTPLQVTVGAIVGVIVPILYIILFL